MTELHYLTVAEASRRIARGKLSPVDLVEASLDRIAKLNPTLNAFVLVLADEARKALNLGLNVMLFSDNVSLEEEISLKHRARGRDLLVMGPDCGTAILDGVPIGFIAALEGWKTAPATAQRTCNAARAATFARHRMRSVMSRIARTRALRCHRVSRMRHGWTSYKREPSAARALRLGPRKDVASS